MSRVWLVLGHRERIDCCSIGDDTAIVLGVFSAKQLAEARALEYDLEVRCHGMGTVTELALDDPARISADEAWLECDLARQQAYDAAQAATTAKAARTVDHQ